MKYKCDCGHEFEYQEFDIKSHYVMCGDSTKIEDVEKLMDGKKADMVFTDPPYNIDYVGKTKEALKIQNDKSSLFEFRNMISKFIDLMVLNTKKGGVYYVCMPLETGVTDLFLEKTHLLSFVGAQNATASILFLPR